MAPPDPPVFSLPGVAIAELAHTTESKVQALSVRRIGGHDHGRRHKASHALDAKIRRAGRTGKNDLPHARMHAVGADEEVALRGRAILEHDDNPSSIDAGEFLQPLLILDLDALSGNLVHQDSVERPS